MLHVSFSPFLASCFQSCPAARRNACNCHNFSDMRGGGHAAIDRVSARVYKAHPRVYRAHASSNLSIGNAREPGAIPRFGEIRDGSNICKFAIYCWRMLCVGHCSGLKETYVGFISYFSSFCDFSLSCRSDIVRVQIIARRSVSKSHVSNVSFRCLQDEEEIEAFVAANADVVSPAPGGQEVSFFNLSSVV